ncbi:hypothetical protein LOTGIDRAFT_170055 [Lottia gigantea]|uniref:Uncharacterized protein n=1 Tax=Lottia gigantea TaxID=225164 RepID=V3ZJ96_LOTGI|nr:hypothetical protein LOTGIDRAFT_170055 [Lottia gigantea]ESO82425.1 hypothetical protein LOTGIDRAFT_170055 [Lottia gigantea]
MATRLMMPFFTKLDRERRPAWQLKASMWFCFNTTVFACEIELSMSYLNLTIKCEYHQNFFYFPQLFNIKKGNNERKRKEMVEGFLGLIILIENVTQCVMMRSESKC